MKKLLHERLREWANTCGEIAINGEWYANPFTSRIAKLLSDEIERYYIPRPQFEDGEPVQDSDMEEIGGMATCCVYTDGSWSFNPDEHEDEKNPKGWVTQRGTKKERIKRPSPKVLDADGVEIKAGDTVYRVEGDWYGHVIRFDVDEHEEAIVLCDSMKSPAKYLTHKEPVLDADGMPIKEGDTVWDDLGVKYSVYQISFDDASPMILVANGGESFWSHAPSSFTHQEPDSLEKLCNDMKHNREASLFNFANRFLAIMERGT